MPQSGTLALVLFGAGKAKAIRLLTVGTKQWGARALGVRIYDFAIWIDPKQAHQQLNKAAGTSSSSLHSSHSDSVEPENSSFMAWFNAAQQQEQEHPVSWLQQSLHSFFQLPASTALQQDDSPDLGSAPSGAGGRQRFASLQAVKGVDMSLTIRAARNLPTHMLTDEFHKCLKRRHATMGGHSSDPALQQIQRIFCPQQMPASSTTDGGAAVLSGACITFERRSGSELHAFANGLSMGSVSSEKLCDALFDLYLGKQPVSPGAKAAADETLRRLAQDVEHFYRPKLGASSRQKLICSSAACDPSTCVVGW
ncbi:MAG: hypothetical protein WDW36_001034 [Sanguina aurantia]